MHIKIRLSIKINIKMELIQTTEQIASNVLEQGNRTAAEIEENAQQWKNYFVPLILSIYNFTFLIMGALVSGILSYIYGKKK